MITKCLFRNFSNFCIIMRIQSNPMQHLILTTFTEYPITRFIYILKFHCSSFQLLYSIAEYDNIHYVNIHPFSLNGHLDCFKNVLKFIFDCAGSFLLCKAFSTCSKQELFFVEGHRLLTEVGSLLDDTGSRHAVFSSWAHRLSSRRSWALERGCSSHGTWA